jgi:hypothetical protein
LILYQSSVLARDQLVFMTKDGITIQSRHSAWRVLCMAPKWETVLYSVQQKNICTLSYSYWSKSGFNVIEAVLGDITPMKNTAVQKAMFMGLPTTIRRWKGTAPKLELMSDDRIGQQPCTFTLMSSDSFKMPPQENLLLSRFYKLPPDGAMPLFFGTSLAKTPVILKTYKIQKGKIPSALFQVPTGYKVAVNESDIFVNSDSKGEIDAFAQMIGDPDHDVTGATGKTAGLAASHSARARTAAVKQKP